MTSDSTRRPLPGQEPLPRRFVVEHQRARIISALVQETTEKGFRAVTVADIVKRAGCARKTFYENFSSKDDCVLSAQEYAMQTALARVVEAAGVHQSWPHRVGAGLTAFLDYVSEEPALAKTCMVEALAASPSSIAYYEESQQAFVSLFQIGRDVSPRGKDLPETLEEAIVGGVFWILYQRLAADEGETIKELLPELVEFALTPYLGPEAARELGEATEAEGAEAAP